jgi:TolA-binding protein
MTDQNPDDKQMQVFATEEEISDFDALVEDDKAGGLFDDDAACPFVETKAAGDANNVPPATGRQNSEDTFSYPELPLEDQLAAEENLDAFGSETSDGLFNNGDAFSLSDEESRPEWVAADAVDSGPAVTINGNEEESSSFSAPSIPPKEPGIPPYEQSVRSQGSNFASALGVVAILVAAVVYWLNMDLSERVTDLETQSYPEVNQMLKTEEQIAALDQKIKASEQLQALQTKTLKQQIRDSEKKNTQQALKLKQHANAISLKLEGLSNKVSKLAAAKSKKTAIKRLPAKIRPVKKVKAKRVAAKPTAAKRPASSATKNAHGKENFDPFVPIHSSAAAPASFPAKKGEYAVILRSMGSEKAAVKELARIRGMGIAADSIPVQIRGKKWYRIWVTGFPDIQTALKQKKMLSKKLGIHDAWIGKE